MLQTTSDPAYELRHTNKQNPPRVPRTLLCHISYSTDTGEKIIWPHETLNIATHSHYNTLKMKIKHFLNLCAVFITEAITKRSRETGAFKRLRLSATVDHTRAD